MQIKTIGRNGIRDSKNDCHYWADWMKSKKGVKVYFDYDVESPQKILVFSAKRDSYMGDAVAAKAVPALAVTDIDKERLRKDITDKMKKEEKVKCPWYEVEDEESWNKKMFGGRGR